MAVVQDGSAAALSKTQVQSYNDIIANANTSNMKFLTPTTEKIADVNAQRMETSGAALLAANPGNQPTIGDTVAKFGVYVVRETVKMAPVAQATDVYYGIGADNTVKDAGNAAGGAVDNVVGGVADAVNTGATAIKQGAGTIINLPGQTTAAITGAIDDGEKTVKDTINNAMDKGAMVLIAIIAIVVIGAVLIFGGKRR